MRDANHTGKIIDKSVEDAKNSFSGQVPEALICT